MAQGIKGTTPTCSIDSCMKPGEKRGLCGMHYRRWRIHGDPLYRGDARSYATAEDVFWARVEVTESCWFWHGSIGRTGYGSFKKNHRSHQAHRFSYEIHYGSIPVGLTIDHVCHNQDDSCLGGPCLHRRCVNPAHLEAVSGAVNTMRGKTVPARHAAATHCPQGHPYDEANTYWRETKGKRHRQCRTCNTESTRRRRKRIHDQTLTGLL